MKKVYVAPQLVHVEFLTEQGFAGSEIIYTSHSMASDGYQLGDGESYNEDASSTGTYFARD